MMQMLSDDIWTAKKMIKNYKLANISSETNLFLLASSKYATVS